MFKVFKINLIYGLSFQHSYICKRLVLLDKWFGEFRFNLIILFYRSFRLSSVPESLKHRAKLK